MTIVNVLTKLSMATAGSAVIALGAVGTMEAAKATTLFNNRTAFENDLSTFIVDDYENPAYQFINSDASMSNVLGQTKYQSTGFNNLNIVWEQSANNHGYCAGCNGSFLLDFTQTTIGNALGVFGAGFDITRSTDYFAHVTFGDNSTQDFSLANQNFWGLTSEKSIKTLYVGLQNGLSTTSGYITIDNLTIGAKSVPEPASLIGILGLGAFGITSLRKRKQVSAVKA
ncbi:PEP-CTERM sorting domain-containing protein [Anabaena sp. UHCC 0204]|nr:PEP-CTERM sorting domain-containing protein [Anabaena sp. UHCC 0204]MTJ09366.1 PEP-CTERM sorting domain-containing protein [Anabaena sp. UHCC 0204]